MMYRNNQRNLKGSQQKRAVHPLEEQEFIGVVKDVASNGLAVVEHSSGVAVFLRGAWVGETVRVKTEQFKKRYAMGVLLELLKPCDMRVVPPCQHFNAEPSCGGCLWQFVDYSAQVAMKQLWVERQFARFTDCPSATIKGSDAVWRYRNRAEFKTDGKKLGFLAAQSKTLIDVVSCPVLSDEVEQHLLNLRKQLPNKAWRSQNKKHPMTLLAVDDDLDLDLDLDVVANVRRPFKQANEGQNQVLKQWLAAVLEADSKANVVMELFCGSGNFTKALCAMGYDQIIAAEVSEIAVEQLSVQKLSGVSAVQANLFDKAALEQLCLRYSHAKTLVLDPPRDGLVCIQPLLDHKGFECVAYISCDLKTCAKDIEQFVSAGYTVECIQPVDMFPHTQHVELCVFLRRRIGQRGE